MVIGSPDDRAQTALRIPLSGPDCRAFPARNTSPAGFYRD